MIFHNTRTITVCQFSEMVMFNDLSKVLRFGVKLPKYILLRRYQKLLIEWNSLNNSDKIDSQIRENSHKLKQLIQINIFYKIMMDMLNITAKFGNIKKKGEDKGSKDLLIEVYSYIYKRKPKTSADYERIVKDIDLKIRRFKQRFAEEDKDEGIDFEQLVINIETILAPVTIRDKKLYTLPRYINMASEKMKKNG